MSLANYHSIRLAAALQNVSAVTKLLAILVLAAAVFVFGDRAQGTLSAPIDWHPASATGVLLAMVSVLWAYDGATGACALAGEVRDPHRNLPRALLLGVGSVITLYLTINVAYLYVLPFASFPSSPLVAADAANAVLGRGAEAIVSGLVMVSTFGTVAAVVMADPRVFFAMARHGNFFASIGTVHARNQTPHVAIAVHCVLALIYVSFRTFEELAATFVLGQTPFYALAAWGVIRLRRSRPAADRPYRTLGYPVVPLVFIGAVILIFTNSLVLTPEITGINVAIILSGFPAYWLWRRFAASRQRL
jgi:APA family basic amino acid/polyamine antiporter